MVYELRIAGRTPQRFDTQQDAMAAAAAVVADDPDAEPEVIDLDTGTEAAPGADAASRETLRKKVGF